jgi:hypothetical protein
MTEKDGDPATRYSPPKIGRSRDASPRRFAPKPLDKKGDHVSGKRGQVEIGVMSSEWHSSPAGVRRSAGNAARRGNPPKDADYCWECRMHMAALWPGIPLTAPPRIADEPAR